MTQEIMNIKDLTLHELAETTPLMVTEQYEALKADIEANGQIDPILVYKGKIIDGRHRWLILQELEAEVITVATLSSKLTYEQLSSIVLSKEMRRHETVSQLAIRAWKEYIKDTKANTLSGVATKYGVALTHVKRANKIGGEKKTHYKRLDILEHLMEGKKINVGTTSRPMLSDSLSTIENWLGKTRAEQFEDLTGLSPRTTITEEEQILVNQIFNRIKDESLLVRKTLSNMIYFSGLNEISTNIITEELTDAEKDIIIEELKNG